MPTRSGKTSAFIWADQGAKAVKKKIKSKRPAGYGNAATTTSWDWGFKPVPGKGGRTRNGEGSDTIIYREEKELRK